MKDPILIGGCGSSGSTLLAELLNRNSKIFCGPELSLFNKAAIYGNFANVKKQFMSWHNKGVLCDGFHMDSKLLRSLEHFFLNTRLIEDWISESHSIDEFVYTLTEHCCRQAQKDIFIEKSPSNVYCFGSFLDTFPNGKVIHLIRDGRDVFCSLKKRGFSDFIAGSRWLYDVNAGIAYRGNDRYLEIYYEQLVNNPSGVLKTICNFAEIPFEDSMISTSETDSDRIVLDSCV